MAKMSSEQKLAAVERYLTSRESSRAVAADFGISHRYLLTLTNQYQKNGVEAFVRRYTNYTKAFKLDVLNYMTEHGTSLNETAAIFMIAGASSVRNWKKQFETLGEDALQPKKKGRQSMKKESAKQSKKVLTEGSTEALQADGSDAVQYFELIKQHGLEGLVMKAKDSTYQSKRSTNKQLSPSTQIEHFLLIKDEHFLFGKDSLLMF